MRDSTTEAIDRFFDLVDNGVEKIDHVLNRGKHTAEQHRARRGKRPDVIEAVQAKPKATKKDATAAASTTALVRKAHFYIVESPTPTGVIFVVTDGGKARTECSTREFAEKILRALEVA